MITKINVGGKNIDWIDVVDPSQEDIEEISEKYGLPQHTILDCLDPEHLPKFEKLSNNTYFLILRAYDENSPKDADTMQELTRKLALFISNTFMITIHRKDQPYLMSIREKWKNQEEETCSMNDIVADLFLGMIASYDSPIDRGLNQLELLEMGVFHVQGVKSFKIKEGYFLKRKAFVFRRIMRTSLDLLPKISSSFDIQTSRWQDVKENAEALFFYADELTESVTSLINLHISMATQKTTEASHEINEVMRVLTIFSIFLLPLNVITGIYGMNFAHMPELQWEYGYPVTLGVMLFFISGTYLWFKKKRWLK